MAKRAKEIKKTNNTFRNSENGVNNFIKILIAVIGMVAIFSLITFLVTNKKNNKKTDESVIQYSQILVGSILNREEEQYYVLVESKNDEKISSYTDMIKKYNEKDDSLKFYTVDLNDDFNSKFISDKENLKITKISDIRFNSTTLLQIQKGKIIKTYNKSTDIQKTLTDLSA